MPESELSDLSRRYDHPGYRAIWRTVLKTQIKQLVEQLSYYAGEEAILLSASLNEGTLSHIGSESGEVFLSTHDQVKKLFLGFCLKRHKKPKCHEDKTTVQCTHDSDKTVTVIEAAHTQTSAEHQKHQTANPCKDKTAEVHRQDSGETSKDGAVTLEDKAVGGCTKNRTVTVMDNAHTQTSAENEKHGTAIIDGAEYIKKEHAYIAEKDSSSSSTSSMEDLDDTSASDFDSDEEMLDDSDEEMLDDKNETVKLDGTDLKDIKKNASTCVNATEVSDEVDRDNADFKFLEMTCDEIATEFADSEFTEINLDKLGETLVIVKDEPDSDIFVDEPQEGLPGTSKDSTDNSRKGAAVGVYSNGKILWECKGKIRWTNPDLEEKSFRNQKESVKPKCQPKTHDTKCHDISDLEEKNSREPKQGRFNSFQHKPISEKYHAIMEVEQGKRRKSDIARKYNVPHNTLSTWLKRKDKIKISYFKDESKRKKYMHQAKRTMLDRMQDTKKSNAASDLEELQNKPEEPRNKPKELKPKRLKTGTPQTVTTKYLAIMEVEQGKKRKCDIAKEFNVPHNTLSTWLKCKDKIKNSYLKEYEHVLSHKVIEKSEHPDVKRAKLD